MKKALPIIFGIAFLFFSLFFTPKAWAIESTPSSIEGQWVSDPEVTFVGKTGARSDAFLRWTLQNYQWLTLVDGKNPLIPFWVTIRNIVYAVIALFVLATAFILIITRGQNITVMRFVPRFVFIVVLITLSFSVIQFIYVINDIAQGFFLRVDNRIISTEDLLFVGFEYEKFTGFRRVGLEFEESAFISLLLVRLTAITYYVMTGLLLVRKIILWFFIIISPVFPLLLFYRPIRNTAKIWIGEFFRWLLYAPLFAIFLHGLVVMWRTGIPLPFDFSGVAAGQIVYPTAINILLGGPGQALSITNTVNLRDTFALYVVALLMLWVVILLPFLLLKIFLDYLASFSFDNNIFLKQFMNRNLGFLSPPKGIPPAPQPSPPGMVGPTGMAKSLPFLRKGAGAAVEPIKFHATIQASVRESANILRLTNLSIPKMRDIARFEASTISRDVVRRNEVSNFHSTLAKIANPASAQVAEREKFSTVREKLLEQKQKGNPIASSVLNASFLTTAKATVKTRQEQLVHLSQTLKSDRFAKLKEQLQVERARGNTLASSILDTVDKLSKPNITEDQKNQTEGQLLDQLLEEEKKGNVLVTLLLPKAPLGPKEAFPIVNRVQQVSLEDYEEVRKLWTENYQTLEPSHDLSGKEVERREWIKSDIDRVNQAVTLLNSPDPARINEGMEMVGNILPFLLIGGFSKSEVIAYLKEKLEAGKSVLSQESKKEEEEETQVLRETKKKEESKALKATVEEPLEEKPATSPRPSAGQAENAEKSTEITEDDSKNKPSDIAK